LRKGEGKKGRESTARKKRGKVESLCDLGGKKDILPTFLGDSRHFLREREGGR